MAHVAEVLRTFLRTDGPTVPLPGTGRTWRRFEVLATWSATDLSVGRLVEGHCDALAILAEAAMAPARANASYGVWAARSSRRHVGRAGGRGLATHWHEVVLFGDRHHRSCARDRRLSRWLPTLRYLAVRADRVGVRSLLARGGHGGLSERIGGIRRTNYPGGPRGGAAGFLYQSTGVLVRRVWGCRLLVRGRALVAALLETLATAPSEHVLADVGVAFARVRAMRDVLDVLADDIDRDPADATHHAQVGALVARQTVHDLSLEVLTRVGAAGGARNVCLNGTQSRRAADLFAYLSQHHGGVDVAQLGQLARKLP